MSTEPPAGHSLNKGKSEGSVGYGRPPVEHQFKPGQGGRVKGSRNKLGEAFIEDLHAAWEKHGMAAIEATIKNHPAQFRKVVAQVLPKDMHLYINPYDHMTRRANHGSNWNHRGASRPTRAAARAHQGRTDGAVTSICRSPAALPGAFFKLQTMLGRRPRSLPPVGVLVPLLDYLINGCVVSVDCRPIIRGPARMAHAR